MINIRTQYILASIVVVVPSTLGLWLAAISQAKQNKAFVHGEQSLMRTSTSHFSSATRKCLCHHRTYKKRVLFALFGLRWQLFEQPWGMFMMVNTSGNSSIKHSIFFDNI